MQCTRCGFQNPPGPQPVCGQCGAPFDLGADPAMRAILPVGRTVLSIVAGYLGLFSVLCFPAPLALGVGIWAILDLKKKPGMHGMGRAVFGVVMGAIGTLAILAGIVMRIVAR
jgi:hypothetical protein